MSSIFPLLCAALAICACREKSPVSGGDNSPPGPQRPYTESSARHVEEIRAAAKDPSLPEGVRGGTEVMLRFITGEAYNEDEFKHARRQLSIVRNSRTRDIWLSLLRVSEENFPDPMPPLSVLAEFERSLRNKQTSHISSSPLRFVILPLYCVQTLTDYNMPDADREVDAFMQRFEEKYGDTEAGKIFLDGYQGDINNAKAGRENGTTPWQYPNPDQFGN